MTMIGSAVYVDGVRVLDDVTPEDAVAQARQRGGFAWIGLSHAGRDELQMIGALLDLHPLALDDAYRGHRRAALERFGDHLYIVLQPAHYDDATESVECSEVDVIAGEDFIITVQTGEEVDLWRARDALEARPDVLKKGTLAVVWAIFEYVVRGYAPVLGGVENDIDEIESSLFAGDSAISRRIFALQREVIELQHATSPLVEMLDQMQQIARDRSGHSDAPAFHEVDGRAQHVIDRVTGFKHTLDAALKVDATMTEQRTNADMRAMTEFGLAQNDQVKKISSWAAILFAPTLVGTIYGMNFDNMPELDWPWGYPLAVALMVATSITLYTVFKKKDWL